MPAEKLKRNRYYDPPTEYPHTSRNHYEDLQEFHQPLARMQMSSLQNWGVARGLQVSGAIGAGAVSVGEGVGIDVAGRLISLAADGHGDIGANPPGGQHDEVTVPVQLATAAHAGTTVFVTIQFSEILRPAEGSGGRMEQVPWVRLQPVAGFVNDGSSLILAIVDLDAGGNVAQLSAAVTGTGERNVVGKSLKELEILRSHQSADTVGETRSALFAPIDGGGLHVTLASSGSRLAFETDGGGNFSELDVRANSIRALDAAGRDALQFNATQARMTIGDNGLDGEFIVRDNNNRDALNFDGGSAYLLIGALENEGDIHVLDGAGRTAMHLDGGTSRLRIGALENAGEIYVNDHQDRRVFNFQGTSAALYIGAEGNEGDLRIRDGQGNDAFLFNGDAAWLQVGAQGNAGDLAVYDQNGSQALRFRADVAALYLGGQNNEGDIRIRNDAGADSISMDGGTGRIFCRDAAGTNWNIVGNPARKVWRVWLLADDGTSTVDVDFGMNRSFYAEVSIVGMDPRANFDSGDAFAVDVFRIDGNKTATFVSGGAHFGPPGDNKNAYAPSIRGFGRVIRFRARSMQNASVMAIGTVYYE